MKTKTYKPKKIGWKWYFILYIVTKILWHMGFDSPWFIITAIVVAIVIFMINRSREKRFKRAIEECKEALQDINNLYAIPISYLDKMFSNKLFTINYSLRSNGSDIGKLKLFVNKIKTVLNRKTNNTFGTKDIH